MQRATTTATASTPGSSIVASSSPVMVMSLSSHSHKPELDFVIKASHASTAALATPDVLDWGSVIDLTITHRVFPHVWRNAREHIPEPYYSNLRAEVSRNAENSLRNIGRTAEVVQLLARHGIDCIVLKGPLLARTLYHDSAMRVSNDVDVLIRRQHVTPAVRALHDAGYAHHTPLDEAALAAHLRAEHDIAFAHPHDQTLIELHADAAQPHYAYRVDLDNWWRQSETANIGSATVKTLAIHHAYMFAVLHAAKHRWHRLDMLVDLAAFQCRLSEPASLRGEAIAAGMMNVLQVSDALTRWLTDPSVVSESPLVFAIATKVSAGNEFGRFDGVWLDLRLRERLRDRVRYLLGLAARTQQKALHRVQSALNLGLSRQLKF